MGPPVVHKFVEDPHYRHYRKIWQAVDHIFPGWDTWEHDSQYDSKTTWPAALLFAQKSLTEHPSTLSHLRPKVPLGQERFDRHNLMQLASNITALPKLQTLSLVIPGARIDWSVRDLCHAFLNRLTTLVVAAGSPQLEVVEILTEFQDEVEMRMLTRLFRARSATLRRVSFSYADFGMQATSNKFLAVLLSMPLLEVVEGGLDWQDLVINTAQDVQNSLRRFLRPRKDDSNLEGLAGPAMPVDRDDEAIDKLIMELLKDVDQALADQHEEVPVVHEQDFDLTRRYW